MNHHDSSDVAQVPSKCIHAKYRPDIDGLRAIAVSSVVVFHAFPTYVTGGFIGVDIFFVISGHLISSIIRTELEEGSFSFIKFYGRRVRRLFPSLILVLVTCFVAGWHILSPGDYKELGAHIVGSSIFVLNFILYRESGYFDGSSDSKILLHLWSLAIEEQFYIVWPIFLYGSWKLRLDYLVTAFGFGILSFTVNIIRVNKHSVQTFYWPTSRIWELLVGACVAFMLTWIENRFHGVQRMQDLQCTNAFQCEIPLFDTNLFRNAGSITGTVLVVVPIFFLDKDSMFPGWWALSPTVGTALLIAAGPNAWINEKFLSSRFLVGIGLISYPLYLWHWPLLVFIRIVLGHKTSVILCIGIIILSVIFSLFTYFFIEKPLRSVYNIPIKVIILCISMMTTGSLGYCIYRQDGFADRFTLTMQAVLNFKYNFDVSYRHHTCFLSPEQNELQFGACVDNKEKPASTAVILWGDSNAAHLYPGIAESKPNLRITQFTASMCPPIVGFIMHERPYCKQINDYIMTRISNEKPNTVILAAWWIRYPIWKGLNKTIILLRNISINNIYLVGPIPQWEQGLPVTLYKYSSKDVLHRIPKRMRFGLVPGLENLDLAMHTFATEVGIKYISLYNILCNDDGCLTRTEENLNTLTMFDTNHLTTAGSIFVVSQFPKEVLHR